MSYEPNAPAHARQLQPSKPNKTLNSSTCELLGFAPFCTQFADNSRTICRALLMDGSTLSGTESVPGARQGVFSSRAPLGIMQADFMLTWQ